MAPVGHCGMWPSAADAAIELDFGALCFFCRGVLNFSALCFRCRRVLNFGVLYFRCRRVLSKAQLAAVQSPDPHAQTGLRIINILAFGCNLAVSVKLALNLTLTLTLTINPKPKTLNVIPTLTLILLGSRSNMV